MMISKAPLLQAPHPGTLRAIAHMVPSSALSISSCGSVRVLANAAQHIPVAVRTMMVVDPGRLPLCHQFPLPTIQPLAYLAAEDAGLGVVIVRMVSGFSRLGMLPDPPTSFRN